MLKTCAKCGKLHQIGERCPESKRFFQTTQERRLRRTNAWRVKSEEIRQKANYLCEVCRDKGIIEYKNIEVHHIIPIKSRPDLYLENLNLISLCNPDHDKADRGEISADYLRHLAQMREGG